MRVACLQLDGRDQAAASRRHDAAVLAEGLADVDLIVLPELWPVGFFHFDDYDAQAEPLDGPTVEFAVGLARERGCWVHGGSFVERGTDGLHNTSVLVDAGGEVRLLYRKMHLFGYQSQESALLTPGREPAVVAVDEGLTLGAATCYDLRFPEQFRAMLDAGAELFCVTSAWPAARLEHWRILCRARAVENLAWLVACNTAGTDNGTRLGGHSIVVDPLGRIVAEAGDEAEVLVAEVDPGAARTARTEFPFLADR